MILTAALTLMTTGAVIYACYAMAGKFIEITTDRDRNWKFESKRNRIA